MSSAFKNFFITFAICLLVFGFLGFQYAYPWLTEIVDFSDMGSQNSEEVSETVSQENPDEVSSPANENNYNENGDVFTAVILCVDNSNRALNTVLIDSNGKTQKYIYCPISSALKTSNEIGVTLSVGDLFATMSPDAIAQKVSTMTGIKTDYCLRFDRASLATVASVIPGASITLDEDIKFINPAYKDYIPAEGEAYPDDYYINIYNVDGKVLLNEQLSGKTKIEWLLEYNPNIDGSEFNRYYTLIAKSLIRQFLEQESSTKSTEVMSKILSVCETNLSLDKASGHLSSIFAYDDYERHEVNCPSNWENAVKELRELDGSYN